MRTRNIWCAEPACSGCAFQMFKAGLARPVGRRAGPGFARTRRLQPKTALAPNHHQLALMPGRFSDFAARLRVQLDMDGLAHSCSGFPSLGVASK